MSQGKENQQKFQERLYREMRSLKEEKTRSPELEVAVQFIFENGARLKGIFSDYHAADKCVEFIAGEGIPEPGGRSVLVVRHHFYLQLDEVFAFSVSYQEDSKRHDSPLVQPAQIVTK